MAELDQTVTVDEAVARKAIERLPWRWALPADAMPAHQYVMLGRCPTDAWDRLARIIRDHPDSFEAYFRGYPRPNRVLGVRETALLAHLSRRLDSHAEPLHAR